MSLIKKELTEKSGYVMEFSVSKEVFEKAEIAAYKKNVKNINVPGFRKGKAPKAIIERMYGKGVFFEDAINACIPEAFEEALKESELNIVGNPQFDIVSTDGDIVLKAVGFVKPEVAIKGYDALKVAKKVDKVTEKEVKEEIERVRERNARTIEITDRACKKKDIANINYEGFVDGVAFDGGKGENHDLKIGSGSFIPGFEDQIVGKKIGEEFDVNVTFPEDYHAKELAGKAAVFKTKLNAIKFEELPALDDEFAKDVSEFDTLDEYKADVKAKLQKRNEDKAEGEFETAVAEALMEKLEAEIPEVMYEIETENYVRDYDARLRSNGLDLKTYFKYTGLTLDALRAQMRPQAERQVKVRLALEKIAALENVAVTEDEINAEYARIAAMHNVPEEQVKSLIAKEDVEADMKVAAAMKFVKEHVKAPAAKKAAAAEDATAEEAAPKAKKATAAKSADEKAAPKKTTAAKSTTAKKTAPKAKKTEEAN